MGRRSSHTPEQLRELILEAATSLIEEHGLVGLSAREIARRIGYSPGTLYNVFSDLDDLVLTIEMALLDRLAQRLTDVPKAGDPVQHLCDLSEAYLAFTQEKPRLWNLLLEHHMPNEWQVPPAFKARLDALLAEIEKAIAPIVGNNDPETIYRATRVLWAGIHGITSLATAPKLSNVTPELASSLVDNMIRTYSAGLQEQARRKV
jgi:AcrR family transcriptional regulator